MARLKSPTKPAPVADPKRRAWTIIALRIAGWQALSGAEREAWLSAWRSFEESRGPCPIDPALFDQAIAAWPSRAGYPAAIESWTQHGGSNR